MSSASDQPKAPWTGDDRRETDRRSEPTPAWTWVLGYRRRRRGRREGESQNAYVDAYERRDVWLALSILALNIFDAFFTLAWLARGGAEGNPVMAAVLEVGLGAFLFQKCLLAGLWLIILTMHKNFRIARMGLWALLVIYLALLGYHLVLFFFGEPIPMAPNSPAG